MPTTGSSNVLRDHSAVAALVVGADGVVQSANEVAALALGARAGRIWRSLLVGAVDATGAPIERERCPVGLVLTGGVGTADVVVGFARRDGTRTWWSLTVRPNLDGVTVRSVTCTFAPERGPAPVESVRDVFRTAVVAAGGSAFDDLAALARAAGLAVPATAAPAASPWGPPR
jgi:hypothetical protein